MKNLLIYLGVINLISLLVYGLDKWLAKKNWYRVSERVLFLFGLFGGALGAISGMLLFHHKTRKMSFYLWNIMMLLIWVYLSYKIMKGSI